MNVVDSSAWLEYFADSPWANNFAEAIEDIANLIVPSITLTEVFKRILQQKSENEALVAIAHMQYGRIINLDSNLAIKAARLGHECSLPLADSIILATARKYQAYLWTQDQDFQGFEEVKYFPKDSPPGSKRGKSTE
ncbi:MAG TPA: type II toxin-antitoxin system VapC family toxin [bacterium]|nr:type II toxin-antitoxin system VapC family toxin [bacterium]